MNSVCRCQVITLLVLGLYPNVCFHKEKRRVLTTESKAALVHKSSVNCSNREINFMSPFFVFGEKVSFQAALLQKVEGLRGVPWDQCNIFIKCSDPQCCSLPSSLLLMSLWLFPALACKLSAVVLINRCTRNLPIKEHEVTGPWR